MQKLTAENYYSPEANQAYMSVSQFRSFEVCEAAAIAELPDGMLPSLRPGQDIRLEDVLKGGERHG